MEYKTGKWYAWDGKQEKPECLEGAELWVTIFDTSGGHYWERGGRSTKDGVYIIPESDVFWEHKSDASCNVIAFYVVSYPKKQKEMTVAEIEKELGYSVKIVK